MNLVLSMQAAYTAPMIMMSQNRKADRDRIEAHNDYLVNMKAEEEIRTIMEHLEAQDRALNILVERLDPERPKNDCLLRGISLVQERSLNRRLAENTLVDGKDLFTMN